VGDRHRCVQWILQRRRGQRWENLSFVSTTKAILARCMRENGAKADEIAFLRGLPDRLHDACPVDKNTCSVRSGPAARQQAERAPEPPPSVSPAPQREKKFQADLDAYLAQIPADLSIPLFLKRGTA
jgi:hypothetical protein